MLPQRFYTANVLSSCSEICDSEAQASVCCRMAGKRPKRTISLEDGDLPASHLISPVTEFLFISGFGASDKKIQELGITCIVDVINHKPRERKDVDYIKIMGIDDNEWTSISQHFDHVSDKILEHKLKNGKTLVHCVQGISRSATLILAYLLKHENLSLKEAHTLLKQKRSVISPNMGFWRQLIAYERQLRGENSIKMVKAGYREVPDIYRVVFEVEDWI